MTWTLSLSDTLLDTVGFSDPPLYSCDYSVTGSVQRVWRWTSTLCGWLWTVFWTVYYWIVDRPRTYGRLPIHHDPRLSMAIFVVQLSLCSSSIYQCVPSLSALILPCLRFYWHILSAWPIWGAPQLLGYLCRFLPDPQVFLHTRAFNKDTYSTTSLPSLSRNMDLKPAVMTSLCLHLHYSSFLHVA